jgi:hypothetical protein
MILEGTLETCPVIQEAEHVLEITHDLGKAMRRLRRKLNFCTGCDHEGNCPALQSFQAQIKNAIAELSEEWVS